MNLNKSGDRAPAIAQDFDTLQRNFNDVQAQLQAAQKAIAALQAAAAPTAPVISSANKVTSAGGAVVAVNNPITGDGSAAKPLGVSVDGTSVKVSAGALTSVFGGLTLAASSGLTGAGTVASPLAANVDGTTIIINGSNQLVANYTPIIATGTTPAFSGATGAGGFTLNAHTVFGTITGVASKTIIPLALYISAHQDDAGTGALWGSAVGYEAIWNGSWGGYTGPLISSTLTLFYNGVGTHDGTEVKPLTVQQATNASSAFQGVDLVLRTNNAANVTSTANKTLNNSGLWRLVYIVV